MPLWLATRFMYFDATISELISVIGIEWEFVAAKMVFVMAEILIENELIHFQTAAIADQLNAIVVNTFDACKFSRFVFT